LKNPAPAAAQADEVGFNSGVVLTSAGD